MDPLTTVKMIMTEYAESTGLSNAQKPPRRYLWTDAFGVCNFLGLYRQTGEEAWRHSALRLVDQVHDVLGHHRGDDERSGWISGLSEGEGKRHPVIGGLRIGKKINERTAERTLRRSRGMGSGRAVLSLFDEMDACPQLRESEYGRSDL